MKGPRVLVCAGLDPSGGAGLLADLEALAAAGARGWAVATALTAQGPRGARAAVPAAPEMLLAQVDALLEGAPELPRAVKTGMLGSAGNAAALAERLGRRPLGRVPLVVDPVLFASSGLSLLDAADAREALHALLARATLATPNWPELEALVGHALASEEGAIRAARELPSRAVLVKGGHRTGEPVDLLVRGRTVIRIRGRRRPIEARGTGCRLASAAAGFLARGLPLEEALRRAKRVVERYLDAELRR
ncbi:MAG: phosphomethylpyrimidine kinase [Anaeromyxobacteraceae bacterium]|jgi:hydroxymethylpyrimidine/phosphomethylpyrimidine kinase|nr:phosphomethylpyrimidine kinase [Anaeromyxobacteraceae bacterium]